MKCHNAYLPLLISVLLIGLSGCAAMNGEFDCNVSSGGQCAPMDAINRSVDEGKFAVHSEDQSVHDRKDLLKGLAPYSLANYVGSPLRLGESVQEIWLAPYEDADGNYHAPSNVYMVVSSGHWIDDPAIIHKNKHHVAS